MSGHKLEWIEHVPAHEPAWIFVSMLLLLGFLAWIRIYYRNILTETLQASSNFQVASRMFNDNSLLQRQLDNALYLFYFLSAGIFLYMTEKKFQWEPYGLNGFRLYAFNVLLLSGVFLLRVVVINLCGYVFNRLSIFREYIYNTFIFNKLIGLAVLPVMLFAFYARGWMGEIFEWLGIALVMVLIIMRIIRGLVLSFRKGISIFYMFLYLCALEIAPLILLYRWLEGTL